MLPPRVSHVVHDYYTAGHSIWFEVQGIWDFRFHALRSRSTNWKTKVCGQLLLLLKGMTRDPTPLVGGGGVTFDSVVHQQHGPVCVLLPLYFAISTTPSYLLTALWCGRREEGGSRSSTCKWKKTLHDTIQQPRVHPRRSPVPPQGQGNVIMQSTILRRPIIMEPTFIKVIDWENAYFITLGREEGNHVTLLGLKANAWALQTCNFVLP